MPEPTNNLAVFIPLAILIVTTVIGPIVSYLLSRARAAEDKKDVSDQVITVQTSVSDKLAAVETKLDGRLAKLMELVEAAALAKGRDLGRAEGTAQAAQGTKDADAARAAGVIQGRGDADTQALKVATEKTLRDQPLA